VKLCGAFDTLLSPIHRAFPGLLAAARSLGDATVYGYVSQLEADGSVVGCQRHLSQSVHHPKVDPLVAPAGGAASCVRTRLVGDPVVGAAEH
jgi:hypothetical protein